MDLVIARYTCRICFLDHVRTYAETESIGEVICPEHECGISSLSAAKNKEIVERWSSLLRNQNAEFPRSVREGEDCLGVGLNLVHEGFNLSNGQDFEVEVELVS